MMPLQRLADLHELEAQLLREFASKEEERDRVRRSRYRISRERLVREQIATARDTYYTSVSSNHASAETGGITFNTAATVTPPGNATTWSRQSARVALGNGGITQSQFVAVMLAISGWEQSQNSLAKATLRSNSDFAPV